MSKKKKILVFIGGGAVLLIIIAAIAGSHPSRVSNNSSNCSSIPDLPVTSAADIATLKSKAKKDLTYDIVNGDPNKYKCEVVQWGGRVFATPEKDQNGIYLQVYNADNAKNYIVSYAKPDFQVKQDDYIIVTGVIRGKFEGNNAFGANLSVPQIEAGLIEAGTRSTTIAPADTTVPVNQPQTQNGFTITLDRIELSASETRFYIKLKNDSKSKVSISSYDAKATQGSKQFDAKSIYNSDEQLPSDVLPGVEAKGVLIFDPIDSKQKQVSLVLGAPYSDNYNLNWKGTTFSVTLP